MSPDEERYWGYSAYRYGEKIGEGENPVPDYVWENATEIRWIEQDPATLPPI